MTVLKDIQRLDLKIDKLTEEKRIINEQGEIKKIRDEIKNIEEKYAKKAQDFEEERLKMKKTEGEVELIESKIIQENNKMYSGKVTNPKELSSITEEIKSLKRQKDSIEEKLIELMDQVDEVEKAMKKTGLLLNGLKGKENEILNKDKERLREIDEDIKALAEEKDGLSKKIDEEVLNKYKELREKIGGRVAAELTEGVCQGCFMALPAEEVDRMLRKKDELWACPNCSRILILGS